MPTFCFFQIVYPTELTPYSPHSVVNIGDMMQRWTQGKYKSNLHRVINFSNEERYSVPFFFNGNLKCKLSPFDGSPVEGGGEAITVFEHMTERFTTTYGRAVGKA